MARQKKQTEAEQIEAEIAAVLPETGRGVWRDPATAGLELVGRRSRGTWYLRHRVEGKRLRDKLEGHWPVMTCVKAREAATLFVGRVSQKNAAGADYVDDRNRKRAKRAQNRKAPTLGAALNDYATDHLVQLRTGTQVERVLRGILNDSLGKRIPDVTRADLTSPVEAKRKTAPSAADAAMRNLKHFFSWLEQTERGTNLLRGIKVKQTTVRDRMLTKTELGKVMNALVHMGIGAGPLAARTLAATGQRLREVQNMRVHELDLPNRTWEIPSERAKNGAAHIVHLNDQAQAAIEAALPLCGGHEFVFLGATGKTPFNGWGKFKARLDRASGVTNWRFHDLRRNFATGCADKGINMVVADMCLNHVAAGTRNTVQRIYQKAQMLDERREAMEVWNEALDDAMAIAAGNNVVTLDVG